MRLKTYNEKDNWKYFLTFLAEDMALVPRQVHWGEKQRKFNASRHAILAIVGPHHVATFNDMFLKSTFIFKL